MTRKLLVARIGIGTLTVAFCAALPGCNLGMVAYQCPQNDARVCVDANPSERPADAAEAGTDGLIDPDNP